MTDDRSGDKPEARMMEEQIKAHCWGEAMWFTPIEGSDDRMIARLDNTPHMETNMEFGELYALRKIDGYWEPVDQSLQATRDDAFWGRLSKIFNGDG